MGSKQMMLFVHLGGTSKTLVFQEHTHHQQRQGTAEILQQVGLDILPVSRVKDNPCSHIETMALTDMDLVLDIIMVTIMVDLGGTIDGGGNQWVGLS